MEAVAEAPALSVVGSGRIVIRCRVVAAGALLASFLSVVGGLRERHVLAGFRVDKRAEDGRLIPDREQAA